jgi:hypothetical protein
MLLKPDFRLTVDYNDSIERFSVEKSAPRRPFRAFNESELAARIHLNRTIIDLSSMAWAISKKTTTWRGMGTYEPTVNHAQQPS